MSKNQSKTETDEQDHWLSDDIPEFTEPPPVAQVPARSRLETRLKIEDLAEKRRLKRLLDDYESFEIEEDQPRRIH